MRVYADGSALVRYLPGGDHRDAWLGWVADHEPDLLVTSLSLSELRAAAAEQPTDVRVLALDVAARLEVVRYFDQAVKLASMSTAVLSPFGALHLGVAVSHPEVDALATYDRRLALVASIHGLRVLTPGHPPHWWTPPT
ncbi:MAG TPA: PIN domain-containing protein [Cellulomonas sp.]